MMESNLSINKSLSTNNYQDKNKSSESFLYKGSTNLFPISLQKIDLSFLDGYLIGENTQEDERIIAEYFRIIKVDEIICCIFIIMTFSCCFIYNEIKICDEACTIDEEHQNYIIDLSLIFSSLTTVCFLIVLFIKYYHYYILSKNARYIRSYQPFFGTSLFGYFILEVILACLHPNLLFKNKYITTSQQYNLKIVIYNVNDFFILIQSLRLSYLIVIVAICSEFYSARADRVCKMMGKKLDLFFAFRALFIRYRPLMLGYCSIIISLMLAYMLKIINQPLPIKNNFKTFGQYFWYVVETMTTIGYGDAFPETTMGRIIGCICAIAGTIVVALIVSFFNSKIHLTKQEKYSLKFLNKINDKEEIMKASAIYFRANMLYVINKKKMENGILDKNKINEEKLIGLIKGKMEAKKHYKLLIHKYHLNFRIEEEFDIVKKRIQNLDYAEIDILEYINLLNSKIKELISNIPRYYNHHKKKKRKIINRNDNNNDINNSFLSA